MPKWFEEYLAGLEFQKKEELREWLHSFHHSEQYKICLELQDALNEE